MDCAMKCDDWWVDEVSLFVSLVARPITFILT